MREDVFFVHADRKAEGNKLIGAWCLTDTEHNVFDSWGTSDYENCIQLKGVYYTRLVV
jgi:hypothetical protein